VLTVLLAWTLAWLLVSGFCLAVAADQVAGAGNTIAIPHAAARHRAELTRQARQVWGLDAPTATFASQVHQESAWRPEAVSRVGAEGLAQFMPSTARWWCELHRVSPADCRPRTPSWALRALVAYDRWLWDRILGTASDCDRMALTLSAYNGGLGWVQRDRALAGRSGLDAGRYWGSVETVNAGRAAWAIRENRDYPARILRRIEPAYIGAGWGRGSCA
jgi:soluble lytic murein transglycosylase-like protein